MWKRILALGLPLLLIAPELHAARCKVDGKWYEYDSPQCKPQEANDADGDSPSVKLTPNEVPEHQSEPVEQITPSVPDEDLTALYVRPWSEVAYLAEESCRGRKYPPTGLDCLMAEEGGYWAMRGNFAMPEHIATHSRAICIAKTTSFGSQATCMQNESRGYQDFIVAREMPDIKAARARKECEQQFDSWSQRGACMRSTDHRHKYPHGRSSRVMARSFVGYDVPLPGYATESEVVTFRVRPPNNPDAAGLVAAPPLPEPLSSRQRAARLAPDAADPDVLEAAVSALNAHADYSQLSAKVPHVSGLGQLTFSWPGTVSTTQGVRLTEEKDSSVGLTLAVQPRRVYLVEFVVRAFDEGSYVLNVGPDTHVFEDLGMAIRNVTVRLIPDGTGAIGLRLSRPLGSGFYFYTAAVTSIEATGLFAPAHIVPPEGGLPDPLETEG